jgi:hypothetical protein
VDDRAGVVAAVDAKVQIQLRGRLQVSRDELAIEVDDRDLIWAELLQCGARRRDRHQLSSALADVAGGPDHESVGGEAPGRPGHPLALARKRIRAPGRVRPHARARYTLPQRSRATATKATREISRGSAAGSSSAALRQERRALPSRAH